MVGSNWYWDQKDKYQMSWNQISRGIKLLLGSKRQVSNQLKSNWRWDQIDIGIKKASIKSTGIKSVVESDLQWEQIS